MGLTRRELYERLGLIKLVDPLTNEAYAKDEHKIWIDDSESSPHGQPWHTSFHASSFPGDDPKACSRKAIYGLMNIPDGRPASRWLRQLADAGKDIETQVVARWGKAGILLSADRSAGEEIQTGFGNLDALIIPKGWDRFHMVEIKTKSAKVIEEMQGMTRGADDKHLIQAKTYVGLAYDTIHKRVPEVLICEKDWTLLDGEECSAHGTECVNNIEIKPTIDGTIYYISRDTPSDTHEFWVTYDAEFMRQGREKLADAKSYFEHEQLPQVSSKTHPMGWKWTELPCKYCPYKRDVCKPDFKQGVTDLRQSNAINVAKSIRTDYDYDETRAAVFSRWENTDGKRKLNP
jgi:hypothetical protein